MKEVAKVIGRLIAVLIDKGLITREEALYITEPSKNKEVMQNEN